MRELTKQDNQLADDFAKWLDDKIEFKSKWAEMLDGPVVKIATKKTLEFMPETVYEDYCDLLDHLVADQYEGAFGKIADVAKEFASERIDNPVLDFYTGQQIQAHLATAAFIAVQQDSTVSDKDTEIIIKKLKIGHPVDILTVPTDKQPIE